MFKLILFFLLCFEALALEISMDSAKDNYSKYSTLHISDKTDFLCQEMKDDFRVTTEIICAFSKKPLRSVQILQNNFFRIDTFIEKDTFFISIKPYQKITIIPEIFTLHEENSIYSVPVSLAKSWLIIGFKDKLPLINNRERNDKSINFPFFMSKDKFPYVGSLDLKGNVVHIEKVEDVTDYLKVKKLYKKRYYQRCKELVDEILIDYPNTLFKAELLYYRIKANSKLLDNDAVIKDSKHFFKDYSSDENIPEIITYTAKAYSETGLKTDADYFFDRLFRENQDSKFLKLGYIYKGQMLEEEGGSKGAIRFYKKALYSTTNIDIAAKAAFNLAYIKLGLGQKDSAEFIDKIVNAKPSYFKEEYEKSKMMVLTYEARENYLVAAKIATALLDTMNATNDDYEILLKDNALWLTKTKEEEKALLALNKYIKQFPDGDYIREVEMSKDAIFFETNEDNATVKLLEYDKLIKEYEEDSIGNKATYKKAKLLLKEQLFTSALSMEESLKDLDSTLYEDVDKIITSAAVGVMKESLTSKECKDALVIANEYNITISNEWDDAIYECAMKGGDYQLSKAMALKNITSSDLELRKKWLYRYVKIDFSIGNYSDVLEASQDLIALIEDDIKSPYRDVYRYMFDTYERLEKNESMIKAIAKIETFYGLDYLDIERYVSVMSIGSKRKDNNIIINYATKVMDIQKSSNSSAQSPYVEFTLYQAYIDIKDYLKALDVIQSLDSVVLTKTARARQKYLLGNIYTKMWRDDEAKLAYEESIQADSSSAWAELAQSAMGI
ncbi:flagellar protein [Sulfurimonas sp.]|uniref:DUF7494 domain-containing protein n=1 Tax=Sulfurimonas sp. TaxID=2022749 RepID=UPI0025D0B831|nr:flagellar protein [Sulfurimonas sp.]MBT5934723.1 flagellar protein [Sulfurimonas sp.]